MEMKGRRYICCYVLLVKKILNWLMSRLKDSYCNDGHFMCCTKRMAEIVYSKSMELFDAIFQTENVDRSTSFTASKTVESDHTQLGYCAVPSRRTN